MTNENRKKRLSRSVRKHLRQRKAALRRELPPDKADKAIARLVRQFSR